MLASVAIQLARASSCVIFVLVVVGVVLPLRKSLYVPVGIGGGRLVSLVNMIRFVFPSIVVSWLDPNVLVQITFVHFFPYIPTGQVYLPVHENFLLSITVEQVFLVVDPEKVQSTISFTGGLYENTSTSFQVHLID